MQTALRIMDEFGFEASIEHASEGHKLVSQLVEHGVSCVVGPTLTFSSKVETVEKTFRTPGILQKAGIPVAVTTDAPVVPIDYLRTSAAMAHREGMSEEAALSSITQTAAEIAGVGERVGSLTPGKDADFQVLDGPPLELTSVVESVYINGGKVYDRQTYEEPWEKKLAAMHGS
jgi:imidazolonepropionase-like amidohydrolase